MARRPIQTPARRAAATRRGKLQPQPGAYASPLAPKNEGGKSIDLKPHKKRIEKIWNDRWLWQKLYDDAYEFAIPYRRPPTRIGKGQQRTERLYDSTAVESAFRAAGQLQTDLFPPGAMKLAPGAISKVALAPDALDALGAQLEKISDIASAFFETGEFNCASAETCVDLMVGTGCLFPVEGDDDTPIRWVCIPFDEIALDTDAYGAVCLISWKTRMTIRAIFDNWPQGIFPKSFMAKHNSNPDDELDIWQDFIRDPVTKRWAFCAYLLDSETPIEEDSYRTQPMAVPRYHRVPGEPYGRGPILLALPTIKTLNKAVELILKAAAIQMLGIWGFRPGGAFNPDTVRLGPGEFWPMQATGGVLGPDVTRLDAASGRIDVGQLVTQELRLQVQSMLGDDRLPDKGATPVSATEIMARMKRISQNYLGAWARIVNELHPVLMRRVIEILYRRKVKGIANVDIDQLLIKLEVLSPITAAVKAAAHSRLVEFMQLVQALKGSPMAVDLIVKTDDALREIAKDQIPTRLITTRAEQAAIEKRIAAAMASIHLSQQQKQPSAQQAQQGVQ